MALTEPVAAATKAPCPPTASSRGAWGAGVVLVVAVALAYANSLPGPFVYDDKPSILYNGTIRQLWPPGPLLHPPADGITVSGRPVLNLSFALNYAIGGLSARGYHVTNLLIHALAALTFFGVVRRTLRHSAVARRLGDNATCAALGVAALWALHPLHTEAVTYIVQRAESLMSLFYLLVFYAFLRSVTAPTLRRTRTWQSLAWSACLLGMTTKENMVSAPVLLFFFDRAFIAGSFAEAWRQRRWFYVLLHSTWILLAALVVSTGGDRGGSAGMDVGVGFFNYAFTQFPALVRYVALAVWPFPLTFDYGPFFISSVAAVWWQAVLVIAAFAATTYALWRHPRIGFLGAVAFAILAPTSLVPGTTQMIVEHRMYLPLAALYCLLLPLGAILNRRAVATATVLAVAALGLVTAARNRVYRSEVALWSDTAAKRPASAVAHSSLGAALKDAGRPEDAIAEDRLALKLNPDYAPALANLGIALTESGRPDTALPYLDHAVQVEPRNAQAHLNRGVTLDLLHRGAEALPAYADAVRLNPMLPAAQNDYGDALCRADRFDDGIPHLRQALALDPGYVEAYLNLGAALLRQGHAADAHATVEAGLALRPRDASARLSWANFLVRQGHGAEALAEYQQALSLRPDSAEAHYGYATALAADRQYAAAIPEYQQALRLRPDYAEAHNNLGNTLLTLDRPTDAIPEYRAALQLRPNDATTHNNLGLALARTGQLRAAVTEFQAAVRLAPTFDNARRNLAHAQAELDFGR